MRNMRKKVNVIIKKAQLDCRRYLMEQKAKEILKAYEIPTTQDKLAVSAEAAIDFAEEIGFPVVLKICSPDIIHKTELGGVIINLKTPTEVREAYRQIIKNVNKQKPKAFVIGVLIQEMVPSGYEVIVGATRDNQFGPIVMFGLGGVFVEILRDVSFRLAPLTDEEALEMIKETKGFRLLEGFRNSKPADIKALTTIITKMGRIIVETPEIMEIEINPLFVYSKGLIAVDTRIILFHHE